MFKSLVTARRGVCQGNRRQRVPRADQVQRRPRLAPHAAQARGGVGRGQLSVRRDDLHLFLPGQDRIPDRLIALVELGPVLVRHSLGTWCGAWVAPGQKYGKNGRPTDWTCVLGLSRSSPRHWATMYRIDCCSCQHHRLQQTLVIPDGEPLRVLDRPRPAPAARRG